MRGGEGVLRLPATLGCIKRAGGTRARERRVGREEALHCLPAHPFDKREWWRVGFCELGARLGVGMGKGVCVPPLEHARMYQGRFSLSFAHSGL